MTLGLRAPLFIPGGRVNTWEFVYLRVRQKPVLSTHGDERPNLMASSMNSPLDDDTAGVVVGAFEEGHVNIGVYELVGHQRRSREALRQAGHGLGRL